MTARRSGRRTAASVGRKRTVARQVGRRQSGKTDALSAAERLRLIRLVTCGGIFVLLVAAKLLLPGRMAGVSQKLSEAMTRSVDVQAVFSAVGGLFTKDGTPAEAAAQAGYQDYSTFSRAYKKQFGHGPSADTKGKQQDLQITTQEF